MRVKSFQTDVLIISYSADDFWRKYYYLYIRYIVFFFSLSLSFRCYSYRSNRVPTINHWASVCLKFCLLLKIKWCNFRRWSYFDVQRRFEWSSNKDVAWFITSASITHLLDYHTSRFNNMINKSNSTWYIMTSSKS